MGRYREAPACRQRTPGVSRKACAAFALPLSKRPGSPSLVSVFPRSRRRITTGYTCDKHSAHLSHIAARHVDNSEFLRMHRRGWRFPQVKGPPWTRPGSRIPSISTAHAQDQCCCAQVIHSVVHSQQVSSPLARARQAAADPRAGVRGDTATGRTRGSGLAPMRSRKNPAADARRRLGHGPDPLLTASGVARPRGDLPMLLAAPGRDPSSRQAFRRLPARRS